MWIREFLPFKMILALIPLPIFPNPSTPFEKTISFKSVIWGLICPSIKKHLSGVTLTIEVPTLVSEQPRRVLGSRFVYRNKHAGMVSNGLPLPVRATARLCVAGQHSPDALNGLVQVDAPPFREPFFWCFTVSFPGDGNRTGGSEISLMPFFKEKSIRDPHFT